MTDYYCDSNTAYPDTAGNTGLIGHAWGCANGGGIQRALGTVAPGDRILIAAGATIDVSKIIRLTRNSGSDAGTPPAVGTKVYEFTNTTTKGDADGWVCSVDATYVYIEQTTATWTATGLAATESSPNAANYFAYTTVVKSGCTPVTNGTLAAGGITVTGCNASWPVDGTRAVLNGNSLAGYVFALGTSAYYDYRWLDGYGTSSAAFAGATTARVSDSIVRSSGNLGFSGVAAVRCQVALAITGYTGVASECVATACTTVGFSSTQVYDCMSYGNARGVTLSNGSVVYGCVIDGNYGDGLFFGGTGSSRVIVKYNRITNNGGAASKYGINADDSTSGNGNAVEEDYNVFWNNGTDGAQHRSNVTAGAQSATATSAAECGYTDSCCQFLYDGGNAAKVFNVGETVSKNGGTWTGTITAVTTSTTTTGILTVSGMTGGNPVDNDAFTATGAGNTASVKTDVVFLARKPAAGTGTPNYMLTDAAIKRRVAIPLDSPALGTAAVNTLYTTAGIVPAAGGTVAAANVANTATYEESEGTITTGTFNISLWTLTSTINWPNVNDVLYKASGVYFGITGSLWNGNYYAVNTDGSTLNPHVMLSTAHCGVSNATAGEYVPVLAADTWYNRPCGCLADGTLLYGTFHASDIVNCSGANIWDGTTIDNVPGTRKDCPQASALYTGTPYFGPAGTTYDGTYHVVAADDALYKPGGAYFGVTGSLVNGNYYGPNSGVTPWTASSAFVTTDGWFGVGNATQGTAAGGGGGGIPTNGVWRRGGCLHG